MKNTCIIVFLGVPITVIIAMVLATLINSLTKAKGIYQCIYFLPYVTSIYAIGIVFKWLFHSDYGYINQFLGLFGIAPLHWLTDSRLVTITVTIFTIWSGMAFKVILFLAGLQKIDKQYYQAARVDGASRFRTFRKVTLPLLSPTIWMVTMMAVLYRADELRGISQNHRLCVLCVWLFSISIIFTFILYTPQFVH